MTTDLVPANLPSSLPNVPNARLPAIYESARGALQECAKVDECKDWADKAEALASYARQSQDETLEKLAIRIRARAIRRCGELLKTFQKPGARTDQPSNGSVTRSPTQREAAEASGLSLRQERTARRVAEVPEQEFEAAVESASPPSVTALADAGRRELSRPKPEGFKEATQALGQLKEFAAFCRKTEPELVAQGVQPFQVARVRKQVSTIDGWLDRLVVNLTEEEAS